MSLYRTTGGRSVRVIDSLTQALESLSETRELEGAGRG